ncbi:hypothetical protein HK096_006858 [Nowakowskiella sp. JEL0078]|nr:hypothetical protein HK096_006858 [Nowakowskiella sp. JEL0078]
MDESARPKTFFGKLQEITWTYIPLSVITFGGPQAHIAILLDLLVTKRKWIGEKEFVELFAIANSLPGPASTELAYAIAVIRAGIPLGIYSFILWSLPGGIVMSLFALGVSTLGSVLPLWLQAVKNGLVAAALGLVALAAFKLGNKLVTNRITQIINLISLSLSINFYKLAWLYPVLMIFGGLVTYLWSLYEAKRNISMKKKLDITNDQAPTENEFLQNEEDNVTDFTQKPEDLEIASNSVEPKVLVDSPINSKFTIFFGLILLGVWVFALVIAIIIRSVTPYNSPLNVLGTFYYVGSIIFGGGPVAIPLLQGYMIQANWLNNSEFLIGYAIISVLPGPMFNFAAFCGALALRGGSLSALGAFLAWFGIFGPGILIQTAIIPIWAKYRNLDGIKEIFKGVNAAAAGLLFSAVYLLSQNAINDTNIINYPFHLVITSFTFVFCGFLNLPSPAAVIIGGFVGILQWVAVGMPN